MLNFNIPAPANPPNLFFSPALILRHVPSNFATEYLSLIPAYPVLNLHYKNVSSST